MKIETNKIFSKTFLIKDDDSAKQVGSGELNVLSTPSLVTYMENTCNDYINKFLNDTISSVGSHININHIAPSKIGKEIIVEVTITEVIKNKIVYFNLKSYEKDTNIEIANGTHTRIIIDKEKFLAKLNN